MFATIFTNNYNPTLARRGDHITLKLQYSESIRSFGTVTIAQSLPVLVRGDNSTNAVASLLVTNQPQGVVVWSENFVQDETGNYGVIIQNTTDGTYVSIGKIQLPFISRIQLFISSSCSH